MKTNAKRSGQRIEDRLEELGWSDSRVVREIRKNEALGPEHEISESTVYRARHGSLLSTDSRHAIATVLGIEKDTIWPAAAVHRARRRRASETQEVAA